MKHLKDFGKFLSTNEAEETFSMDNPMNPTMDNPMDAPMDVHFETETTDIISTDGNTEGNYFVNFRNSDGKKTTIEINGAADPEFVGDTMISDIEMVEDSSSDGKKYSVIGYYNEIPGSGGGYNLEKVLLEEI